MDPNGGKKDMFNKLSKDQCLDLLNKEKFNRITVSFYKYIFLENLEIMRDDLYSQWDALLALGRVYISREGINAQLSIPEKNWEKFKSTINANHAFKMINFKIAANQEKSFFKLTIKVKDKIVADGLSIDEYDVTNVGKHLSAKEWNKFIDLGATVVDMRNHYESEIGRFQEAICPTSETFREELPMVKDILKGKEKEKILLYCTGGIRCEKASSYLKHYGFKDVNQLHGGIIDYFRQINKDKTLENKFLGKNFVFDERRSERISKDIISRCHQCENSCDTHVNCKNVNCNLLFLQCKYCNQKYQNCCSLECIDVLNLSKEEQKELRKGVNNPKKYYSHKKINLKLK